MNNTLVTDMMIKLNCLVCFLLLGLPFLSFGAWPTPEGLFRNSNNADVSGNLIILRFMVEELATATEGDSNPVANPPLLQVASNPTPNANEMNIPYYKFIFSISNKDTIHFLQVRYNDPSMKMDHVQEINFIPGYVKKITDDNDVERMLFYSLINTLVLNDSRAMNVFLKRYGKDYSTNKELLDANRTNLLLRYKRYLQTIKENSSLKTEIESPLGPKSLEDRGQVTELMSLGLLNHTDKISMTRENNSFFWKLDLQAVVAYFSNEQQRLDRFVYTVGDKTTEVRAANYVLFDGIHELPKDFWMSTVSGKVYKIRMISLEHANNKNEKVEKIVENYKTALKEKKTIPDQKVNLMIPFIY
jgi:hypothetical protein